MPSSRAFTLVELLVVISIIALLAAIAGPAIAGARGAARSVVCGSNTGQLATAAVLYAQDNRDSLWQSTDWIKLRAGQQPPKPGLIHEYLGTDSVLECPGNRRRRSGVDHAPGTSSPSGIFTDHAEIDTDYSHVHNISGLRVDTDLHASYFDKTRPQGSLWETRVLTNPTGLKPLPGVPVFVEESTAWANEQDGWNTWIGADQLTRRHGGASLAFLDTHVETLMPPGGRDELTVEEGDLTSQCVYVSVDGRTWYMLGWQLPYSYGWANNPR